MTAQDETRDVLRSWLLLGCRGSGMKSFAELIGSEADRLLGMDGDESGGLVNSGGVQQLPWNDEPDWRLLGVQHVVHSLAIPDDARILKSAREHGVHVRSLPKALQHELQDDLQICVAGTHGKSTTTAMIAWILSQAGLEPQVYVGAELQPARDGAGLRTEVARATGAAMGKRRAADWIPAFAGVTGRGVTDGQRAKEHPSQRIAVIEACEFRRAFLAFKPQSAVLTGIEADHFDCFTSNAEADSAFRSFLSQVQPNGTIIVNADCPRARAATTSTGRRVVSWSSRASFTMPSNDFGDQHWQVSRAAAEQGFVQQFRLRSSDGQVVQVRLTTAGTHNIANAVGAMLAAHEHGVSLEDAARFLESFPGLRRRFEDRGVFGGVQFVDDYAHHPTAVRATLETARRQFPGRRLIAIFEPHQSSRLSALFADFVSALCLADECLILPVLPAREQLTAAECRRQSGWLVRGITASRGRAFLMANLDQVPGRLDHSARPGDVVLTLGAGRTDSIHEEVARRVLRNPAA